MAKKYLKKACDLGKEHIGVKYDPDLKKSWQEAAIFIYDKIAS